VVSSNLTPATNYLASSQRVAAPREPFLFLPCVQMGPELFPTGLQHARRLLAQGASALLTSTRIAVPESWLPQLQRHIETIHDRRGEMTKCMKPHACDSKLLK